MRNTPRHMRSTPSSGRGIGTLIGNGWLRESPRNPYPNNKWDLRSRSALRKCMFLPIPDQLRDLLRQQGPNVSGAALAPLPRPAPMPAPRVDPHLPHPPHRHDPRKDAREFPAYVPGGVIDPRAAAQHAHNQYVRNAQKVAAEAAGKAPRVWWEDPVALGSLLILVPPIGLAAVWSSKRYSSDARWALTVMTALTMCLMSAIVIAVLASG